MATETRNSSFRILRLVEDVEQHEPAEPGGPAEAADANRALFQMIGLVNAKSPSDALKKYTEDTEPGTYVAVVTSSWYQKTKKPREGFDLV